MRFHTSAVASNACAIAATGALWANTTAFALPTVSMGVYEEKVTVTCPAALNCRADFAVVATPLKITTVSCNFYHSDSGGQPGLVSLVLGNGPRITFTPWQYLAPITSFAPNNSIQYQVLADTLHVIKSARPSVEVAFSAPSDITLICTISGEQQAP